MNMLMAILKRLQTLLIACKSNNVSIGKGFHCGRGTYLWAPNKLNIGSNVYIGKYCTIECDGQIGDGTLIANLVGIIGRYDHDYASIGTPIRFAPWIGGDNYCGPGKNQKVIIDKDVWLGYNSIILSGVTVGRGAIIGAGTVVVNDVEPYAIMAGVPAKKVDKRMNTEQIHLHEKEMAKWDFHFSEKGYKFCGKTRK